MSTLDRLEKDFINDPALIGNALHLGAEDIHVLEDISVRYPIRTTPYYLGLIDPDDPSDPIRKMCLPGKLEYETGGAEDTSGEGDNTVLPGMQHKYRQTALILSTNQCAMYCRHCFRKRLVGYSSDEIAIHLDAMAEYVASHPEITNVLISGGDSFMNDNAVIRRYLETFSSIPSLGYIRFGTRTPVVLPERIWGDEELLSLLRDYSRIRQIYVVTHFNHPHELTQESRRAVRCLIDAGCIVRNQTVLLKGVNDDPAVLTDLWNQLAAAGVIPYYVFQCRPARGVLNEFQIPLLRGSGIIEDARTRISGQAKSLRYVFSHVTGKIEILGRVNENELLLKYHQARQYKDANRIFTYAPAEDQCWIDQIPG